MGNLVPLNLNDTQTAFEHLTDKKLKNVARLFQMMNNPALSYLGPKLVTLGLFLRLPIRGILTRTLFDHFCGGESLEECQDLVNSLGVYKVGAVLSYSVEDESNEESFEKTSQEIIHTIHHVKKNTNIPFAVFKPTGILSYQLLTKKQENQLFSASEQQQWENGKIRLDKICKICFETGVKVFIDAEKSYFQNSLDELVTQMMEKYNKEKPVILNTIQLYRKDGLDLVKKSIEHSKSNKYFLGLKLVRGAYLDEERDRARKFNYPSPVFDIKQDTDRSFDESLRILINNLDKTLICVASHNEQSSELVAQLLDEKNIHRNHPHIHFSQLYGMSDHITFNLAKAGYNTTKYIPYGPLESVLPYLFRRAEENRSIAGQSGRELLMINKELNRRKDSKSKE